MAFAPLPPPPRRAPTDKTKLKDWDLCSDETEGYEGICKYARGCGYPKPGTPIKDRRGGAFGYLDRVNEALEAHAWLTKWLGPKSGAFFVLGNASPVTMWYVGEKELKMLDEPTFGKPDTQLIKDRDFYQDLVDKALAYEKK